jgi:hypothetical protein
MSRVSNLPLLRTVDDRCPATVLGQKVNKNLVEVTNRVKLLTFLSPRLPRSPLQTVFSNRHPPLLKVNRDDDEETDFQLLLESDIGVVLVEDDKLEDARRVIAELKGEGQ